jgi:hypothetical protein
MNIRLEISESEIRRLIYDKIAQKLPADCHGFVAFEVQKTHSHNATWGPIPRNRAVVEREEVAL